MVDVHGSRPQPEIHRSSRRADLRGAAVFTALALAGGWIGAAPLWIAVGGEPVYGSAPGEPVDPTGGADPATGIPDDLGRLLVLQLTPMALMFTPALAAWATMRWVHGRRFRPMLRELGLGTAELPASRRRPMVSLLLWALISLAGTIGLVILSVGIAWALGYLRIDGSLPLLEPSAEAAGMPAVLLLVLLLGSVPFAAVVPNALFAAGEEIGWRGYLLPHLVRLWGTTVAVLVSGIVWGLWHAPLILLGYNFARPHVGGVLLMVIGCVAVGAWLSWLTLRSGTVWPAIVGHGALNAAAGLYPLVSTDLAVDGATAGPLGVAAWIAFGVLSVLLFAMSRRQSQPRDTTDDTGF